MAELSPAERLQPSLLDRLTDLESAEKVESRDKRVLSIHGIRQAVLRDLGWLLNTTNLHVIQNLDGYPEVQRSTVNFGIPDLAGLTSDSIDTGILARVVRQAILDFEPRILAKGLSVRIETNKDRMSGNALVFIIEGNLWARPTPLALHLRTEVDLETSDAVVFESRR